MLVLCLVLPAARANEVGHPQLKAYPPPARGMQRFVIVLPHKERGEEDAFAVELLIGKDMLTDGVNLVRLGVAIEARPLQGWGYTYYEVTGGGRSCQYPDGAAARRPRDQALRSGYVIAHCL